MDPFEIDKFAKLANGVVEPQRTHERTSRYQPGANKIHGEPGVS